MATKIDICNMALSMIGAADEIVSIEPADGGPQAGHCARWYPIAVRRVFESANWSFATRIYIPAQLTTIDAKIAGWQYAFQLPSNCVKLLSVKSSCTQKDIDFQVMQFEPDNKDVLLADCENIVISYVTYLDAPENYPQYFIEPIVLLLASYLVGPVKRSDATSQNALNILKQYEQSMLRAVNLDAANSRRVLASERIGSNQRVREIL